MLVRKGLVMRRLSVKVGHEAVRPGRRPEMNSMTELPACYVSDAPRRVQKRLMCQIGATQRDPSPRSQIC